MQDQLNLFATSENEEFKQFQKIKLKKKRVHYLKPSFIKHYTILTDINGIILEDENIFISKKMFALYGTLASYLSLLSINDDVEYKDIGLMRLWFDLDFGNTAEIRFTARLSLTERYLIHKRLLHLINQNIDIQKACKKALKYWYKTDLKSIKIKLED